MARTISKNQVSDPGPSWPSCVNIGLLQWQTSQTVVLESLVFKFFNKFKNFLIWWLKGGPLDHGTKIFQKYWKIILIFPKPSNFHWYIPVVENQPTTREIRDLIRPRSTPSGKTVYFYMSSSFIYILEIHRQSFKRSVQWRHYGK